MLKCCAGLQRTRHINCESNSGGEIDGSSSHAGWGRSSGQLLRHGFQKQSPQNCILCICLSLVFFVASTNPRVALRKNTVLRTSNIFTKYSSVYRHYVSRLLINPKIPVHGFCSFNNSDDGKSFRCPCRLSIFESLHVSFRSPILFPSSSVFN